MDKSEKSYYSVIGNKKRGKFSGAGPIQVAKKVASKITESDLLNCYNYTKKFI
jgi:hypothetical protein